MEPRLDLSWVVCLPVLLLLVIAAATAAVVIILVRLRDLRVRIGDLENAVRRLQDARTPPPAPGPASTGFQERVP
jgi:hypothetical protein